MNLRNDRATWIKGGTAQCSIPPKLQLKPPRLVLLGAPGIGKGTQAEYLCTGLEICHLATGDILRAARCLADDERTPAMTEALKHMQHGEVVPDQTVLNLLNERLACLRCRGGFLLDGFPQTVAQARALDNFLRDEQLHLDAVLNYSLPFDVVVKRLSARRTCLECRADFHLETHPPQTVDVCDYCGGILGQREDDLPEAVTARILAYEKATKPLIEFYLGRGLLRTISAEGPPERIYQRTLAILDP